MQLTDREFMSSEEINQMQLELVKQTVGYAGQNSKYYRKTFKQEGIQLEDIKSFADFSKLPFTGKDDLQIYNEELFCVPKTEIVEFVSTSGTTGEPVVFPLTKNDLERLKLNEALSFSCANAQNTDAFQIMVNMGNLFVAGLAYYLGLTHLGATTYRIGAGLTQRQLYLLNKFRPNGLVSVPSFLIKLRNVALEEGIDVKDLGVEKIVLIGEPILEMDLTSNPLGKKIEEYWGVRPFSSYGSTEMSTSFAECIAHQGLHSHPELIYFEIVDEKGQPVPDGMLGELIVTTLQAEGMPLLRYQTGDITFKISGRCDCGRSTDRIGPIIGRKNQMIKSKGTTIYPGQIEKALLAFKEITDYIIQVSTGAEFSDVITLKLGMEQTDENLIRRIKEQVNAIGRVTPEIEVYQPAIIEKMTHVEGKTKQRKFIDLREQVDLGGRGERI